MSFGSFILARSAVRGHYARRGGTSATWELGNWEIENREILMEAKDVYLAN